jgi:hypothetical protein
MIQIKTEHLIFKKDQRQNPKERPADMERGQYLPAKGNNAGTQNVREKDGDVALLGDPDMPLGPRAAIFVSLTRSQIARRARRTFKAGGWGKPAQEPLPRRRGGGARS